MRSGIHPPQRRRLALVIALVVAIVLLLRFWPAFTLLDGLELQTLDWRFTQRGPRPPHPDIVIVTVDQSSIAEIGRWPWPRRIFADVIRTVSGAGASAIVFDIFFADPDDSAGGAASDAELIDATREAGIVYHAAFGRAAQQQGDDGSDTPDSALASQSWEAADVIAPGGLNAAASLFGVREVTAPLPGLIDAACGVGFVNVVDSGDGVYRHTFAVLEHEDRLYPSLSVAAAAGLLGAEPEDVIVAPGEHVELNDQRRIPLDRMGRTLVNFAGGAETYPFIPVREVLTMGERAPELARERFKDTIVLVAVTAPGLYDLRASPFDAVYYGVE
ncbi:MAG: CHASE2 domain-containing protein, partial [Armatimonadota bacterium]